MALTSHSKTDTNTVELLVSVDKERFSKAVSQAYQKNGKKLSIPGFRKGKAPRSIIEKMYGADFFYEDAVQDTYSEAYAEAVQESGIDPVDYPEIEVLDITADGYSFKAVVTVKPEVVLGEYKGLKADKTVREITDDAIDAEIAKLTERNSRIVDVTDRESQMGDIAVIDFDGSVDGVPFDGGKAEKFSLTLGSGQFIPGFEEQVAGHKLGDEFDVGVTFPEAYGEASLAGKPAVFKCKLHELKHKELPLVDDEFAKDVSEFETLAELKADIKERLQKVADERADTDVENALVEQLIEGVTVEIPACMIDARIDEQLREFEYQMQSQGITLDLYLQHTQSTRESIRADFKPSAEKQVKIRLSLEEIAKAEKLEISDEELAAEYDKLAENYRMEVERIKTLVLPEALKLDMVVNKAVDLVKSSAVIKDVKEKAPAAKKPAAKKATAKKDEAEKKPAAEKKTAAKADGDKEVKKAPAKKKAEEKKTEDSADKDAE